MESTWSTRVSRLRDSWATWRHRAGRVAFGDRVGLALFLAALAFFGLYWRIGIFITDNFAIANALVGVADGHLHVDRIVFGPEPEYQPGMNVVGERLYGRNYGHVFFALPFLWALELVAIVAAPRIAIAGAWSIVVIAFGVTVGRLVGRHRAFAVMGSVAGLCLFAANVALATPLDPLWLPVVALQLATMVAAAFVGVVLYRLVALFHARRVGVFAGCAVVFATPVGFWASIPKRHVVTALLALVALYGFARSRAADGDAEALRFRAASYVAVGLTAWVHAAEALLLFAVLVPLDLSTARSNDPRRLVAVGLAFVASLLPFLVTNVLIVGNPLRPPRLLPRYNGNVDVILEGTGSGSDATPIEGGGEDSGGDHGGDGTPTENGSGQDQPSGGESSGDPTTTETESSGSEPSGDDSDGTPGDDSSGDGTADDTAEDTPGDDGTSPSGAGPLGLVSAGASSAEAAVRQLVRMLDRGITTVTDSPERLYHTFVRSGWIGAQARDGQAVNLTVLETTPLLGALVALPVLAGRYARNRWRARSIDFGSVLPTTAAGQTDAFALLYTLAVVVFYIPRLPLHAQVTVRYLVPIVPMLCYALARLSPIRRVLKEAGSELTWSYAGFVLVGGQLGVVGFAALQPSAGEALQLFALVGLAVAGLTGAWVLADLFVTGLDPRIGAGVVALTGAVSTTFLLLTGWVYLRYGDFALGLPRLASDLLSVL